MNLERVHEILDKKQKCDVFYNERPIWVQDVKDDIAHIGFVDKAEEKDVYIEDLYENDLYHNN